MNVQSEINRLPKLAFVGLGANLFSSTGSPPETLRAALRALAGQGCDVVRVSRFWRSPAYPPGSGPDYVNAAAAVATPLGPDGVLAALHRIEAALGRVRDGGRWKSRGIDLDLLGMGDLVLPDAATQDRWRALPVGDQVRLAPETLILPHPRMQDRGFVLAPLAEIAPAWIHPRTGRTVAQMLAALDPQVLQGIVPLDEA
jgi:2-amino-4-hydroxy-6-hydroxymethyldihydropteridine diphosphokinase